MLLIVFLVSRDILVCVEMCVICEFAFIKNHKEINMQERSKVASLNKYIF